MKYQDWWLTCELIVRSLEKITTLGRRLPSPLDSVTQHPNTIGPFSLLSPPPCHLDSLPRCANGLAGLDGPLGTCCKAECGTCDTSGNCIGPGNDDECCVAAILSDGVSCGVSGEAPCFIGGEPACLFAAHPTSYPPTLRSFDLTIGLRQQWFEGCHCLSEATVGKTRDLPAGPWHWMPRRCAVVQHAAQHLAFLEQRTTK